MPVKTFTNDVDRGGFQARTLRLKDQSFGSILRDLCAFAVVFESAGKRWIAAFATVIPASSIVIPAKHVLDSIGERKSIFDL